MLSTLAAASVAAHWGGPWGGGPGWLFLLIPLFWIAVFVLIFTFAGSRWRRAAVARGGFGPGYGHGWGGPSRGAEATLAERFAQGDIDEVEYRARLEVLRANRQNEG